jgi:hypothetical protein
MGGRGPDGSSSRLRADGFWTGWIVDHFEDLSGRGPRGATVFPCFPVSGTTLESPWNVRVFTIHPQKGGYARICLNSRVKRLSSITTEWMVEMDGRWFWKKVDGRNQRNTYR